MLMLVHAAATAESAEWGMRVRMATTMKEKENKRR